MYVTQEEHVKDMKHMQEQVNDANKRLNDYTDDIHAKSVANTDYLAMMTGVDIPTTDTTKEATT